MKQSVFETNHEADWQAYDSLCTSLQLKGRSKPTLRAHKQERGRLKLETQNQEVSAPKATFPALYRKVCQHYALAKARGYSPKLVQSLHDRVLVGHQLLYENKTAYFWRALSFLWVTFPNLFRRHARLFWLTTALFYLPALATGLACYFDSEIVYSILDETQVASIEYMYDPQNTHIGRSEARASDTDVMMLGFYIFNNISIDFRTFALGMLAGVGTLFILLFNGVFLGAVAGHLTQVGFTQTFWSFVVGHGSFELTALVISAMAGLRLAQPLYSPGAYSRFDAFKIAGRQSVQLLLGAAFMTLIAAFIEAFWSSSTLVPATVKYVVGAFLWLLVFLYLALAGRGAS